MNIRVRKHNDNPDWIVAELIVDGLVMDDRVGGDNSPGGIIRLLAILVTDCADKIDVDYVKGLDDHPERFA